jgi:5'-nucleotidase
MVSLWKGYKMTEVIISSNNFEEIKKAIINGGIENFHVLADFDRTLTRAFYGGEKASSLISQLRDGRYLTEDYPSKAHALFDEYHPIEIDTNIPFEEKKKKMYEWWKKHFDLLIESGLDKKTISNAIKNILSEDTLVFRDGVEEFLIFLKENDVPLIIMSSSIGDMIIEFMKEKRVYYDNIHIISNLLEWNGKGKSTGIKEIIHVFNKSETEVKIPEIQKRKNVLLLGDSIGDLGMIEGFEYDNLLAIGFLNEKVENNLENFKEMFDVVLLGDGDFTFINDLIREIVT